MGDSALAALSTAPSGEATRLMVFKGEWKFWLYFDLRFGLEEAFIGMSSWRCCRETEI
jgi:hypothetical protein